MHTMADYFMDVGMEKGMSQGLEQGMEQGMSKGREQGISTGKELGIIEGRKQIIEQLLDSGFSREKMAELLQMKKEELDNI